MASPFAVAAYITAAYWFTASTSFANPAVTIAVWLRGRCKAGEVPGYFIAQILAAVAAAKLALLFKGCPTVVAMTPNVGHALAAEFIGTFGLAYVILNVATAKGTAGNSFYGLAIGFTVVGMAFALGGISGGAFNPAVAVGITVMGLAKAANLWIYLAGNFGAAIADDIKLVARLTLLHDINSGWIAL